MKLNKSDGFERGSCKRDCEAPKNADWAHAIELRGFFDFPRQRIEKRL